jgi:hypothetical protein
MGGLFYFCRPISIPIPPLQINCSGFFVRERTLMLDQSKFASERMSLLSFHVPESMHKAVNAAAARMDPASPNKSAFLRGAVLTALLKEPRS